MTRVEGKSTTVLLIEDDLGSKFGAFCLEDWKPRDSFFGEADTTVFTFKKEGLQAYKTTGDNFMYQYCDKNCLMVGGDNKQGRPAIYLGDGFHRGSSSVAACFNN
jgi:hypothetical protein